MEEWNTTLAVCQSTKPVTVKNRNLWTRFENVKIYKKLWEPDSQAVGALQSFETAAVSPLGENPSSRLSQHVSKSQAL